MAAPPPLPKPDYGIDLGAATSLEALRVHWVALKAIYGPLLVGLHPVATQHTKTPTGVTYRLVAGPLVISWSALRRRHDWWYGRQRDGSKKRR